VYGPEVWTNRLHTYFVLAMSLVAGLALPWVVEKGLPGAGTRWLFCLILFGSLLPNVWSESARVYNYYENPAHYYRLHPAEQEGLEWIATNLPPHQVLVGNASSRIPEWLAVYTTNEWQKLPATNPLWNVNDDTLSQITHQYAGRYLLFFRHRGTLPAYMQDHPAVFVPLFSNAEVAVLRVKPTDL